MNPPAQRASATPDLGYPRTTLPEHQQPPKVLYRYRPIQDLEMGYAEQVLLENKLYSLRADQLNDIFEFRPVVEGAPSRTEASAYASKVAQRLGSHLQRKDRRTSKRQVEKRIANPDSIRKSLEDACRQFGITCMAERPDNLLMWAHYGSQHTGFCIGLTLELKDWKKGLLPLKVKYSRVRPTFSSSEVLKLRQLDGHELIDFMQRALITKSEEWEYEQEWRLISRVPGQTVSMVASSVREVVFGTDMPLHAKNQLAAILVDRKADVQSFQAVRDEKEFAIRLKPMSCKDLDQMAMKYKPQ